MRRDQAQGVRADEAGNFQVFEALLVALIIITGLIFVNSVQRPTILQEGGGEDLGDIADGVLFALENYDKFKNSTTLEGYDIEDVVTQILRSDVDAIEQVEDFMRETLPTGVKYKLFLDNGVEPFFLLPKGGSNDEPRAARAAQTFVFANWTAFNDNRSEVQWYTYPGGPDPMLNGLSIDSWTTGSMACDSDSLWDKAPFDPCLRSPMNSTAIPPSASAGWAFWWQQGSPLPPINEDGTPRTQPAVPPGIWRMSDDGIGCTPCYFQVGLPDGTFPLHPVYTLELVVWFNA